MQIEFNWVVYLIGKQRNVNKYNFYLVILN